MKKEINFFLNLCTDKNLNIFLIDILQQSIQLDPWIIKIYQLKLSNSSKQILLSSGYKIVSSIEINLYVQKNLQYLYSQNLYKMLQIEFNKNFEKLVQLNIIEKSKFFSEIPIFYIYQAYMKSFFQLKQECLNDPYVKIIQNLFDATFNEKDIEFCQI